MINPAASPAPGALPTADSADGQVTARLRVATTETGLGIDIEVRVRPGYHVFAPGATQGLPVEVTLTGGSDGLLRDVGYPPSSDGRLSGVFQITGRLSHPVSSAAIAVRVQPCNGMHCLRPSVLRLHWQEP